MDKKQLLRKSLARIMDGYLQRIHELVSIHGQAAPQQKNDGSPVTALDLALSSLIEDISHQELSGDFNFYSEEKFDEWQFPLLALDPLDGTREFIAGRPEWAISIGLFKSEDFVGEGWIYNPVTKEKYSSETNRNIFKIKNKYIGESSRSEWGKGLFTNQESSQFEIRPMGSIAYKLGRLSAGQIDFVISKTPKNIWDIAGGTLLCKEAGINFYSNGKLVTKVQKKYDPPLIWCHERLFSGLSETFS